MLNAPSAIVVMRLVYRCLRRRRVAGCATPFTDEAGADRARQRSQDQRACSEQKDVRPVVDSAAQGTTHSTSRAVSVVNAPSEIVAIKLAPKSLRAASHRRTQVDVAMGP